MASFAALCQNITKCITRTVRHNANRSFSACSHMMPTALFVSTPVQGTSHVISTSRLLSPPSVLIVPTAGMKQMGKLRRRCKHCFFIMIDERLHIWCDAHPRHKQMQMITKPKDLMKLAHATQGKIRPW